MSERLTADDLALYRGAKHELTLKQGALDYVSRVIAQKYQVKPGDSVNEDTGDITRAVTKPVLKEKA